MIITLTGADFSANNINSSVKRYKVTFTCKDSNGSILSPASNTRYYTEGSSVTFSASNVPSISGYTFQSASPASIANISADTTVTLTYAASGGGSDSTKIYTFTITPTPETAIVTLAADGQSIVSGTGEQSITVNSGTLVNYMVATSGYATKNEAVTISSDLSQDVVLIEYGSSGTNIPITWYKSEYYYSLFKDASYQTNQNLPLNRSTAANTSGTSNHANFWCTQLFTKDNLPNGSVITIKSGYRYRPDGGIDLLTAPSVRPDNISTTSVTVTDSWWDNIPIRGFNISNTSNSSLSGLSESDLNDIFTITLP